MPNTWFPHRGISRRVLNVALAALLLFATLVFTPGGLTHANAQTTPDPGSCDADILFILDSSGSMTNNGNEGLNAIEDAVKTFVDTLGQPVGVGGAPDSGIAAVHFSDWADIGLTPYINVVTGEATIDAYVSPGGAFWNYSHRWTNWQAAFEEANTLRASIGTPDVVFFLTDGQPTRDNDTPDEADGDPGGNHDYDDNAAAAVPAANSLRAAVPGNGSVIGVGVGADFTDGQAANIARLGTVVDEVRTTSFEDLADELVFQINTICAPSLTVDKSVNPTSLPEPGGTATFTAEITNTSDSQADIMLTALSDDVYGGFPGIASCKLNGVGGDVDPLNTWIPYNESMVCTWQNTFDEDPGFSETDTVTATGVDPLERETNTDTDSATFSVVDAPSSIKVTKTVSGDSTKPEPGGTFAFDVLIENTSSVDTVTIESITDAPYGSLTGVNPGILSSTCSVDQVLAPGASYPCSFTVEVLGEPGSYPDTVTASGTDDDGDPVSGSDEAIVEITDVPPTITVDKSANPTSVDEPGGDVTFTVKVTNDSDEAVTITSLEDDIYGTLAGDADCKVGTVLDAGASCSFSFTEEVTGDPGDTHTNTATVIVIDDDETTAEDSDKATVTIGDIVPSISVLKSANPTSVYAPGEDVTFTVVVTNEGEETVTITSLVDDIFGTLAGDEDCKVGTVLDAGENCSFSFTEEVTGDPGDTHTNTVTAIVVDDDETSATASDDATVTVRAVGDLVVSKLVEDPVDGWVEIALFPAATTDANWQITLTNPNDFDIAKMTVTDVNAPACETAFATAMADKGWAVGDNLTLPAGESVTFECASTVTAGELASNTAIGQGVDPLGRQVGPVEDTALIERLAASGTIGDTVWADENENGKQDNGEKGISGAKVKLTLPDSTVLETTTNASGLYLFSALEPGTYTAAVVLSSIPKPQDGDLKLTTAGSFTITLADGEAYLDADFGVASTLPKTGISSDRIALIGLALLLAGGLVVLVTRPRRKDEGPDQMAA